MSYATFTKLFDIKTSVRLEFITITKHIQEIIRKSSIQQGLVVIQTLHTTARLWINEDEKNLIGGESVKEADMHRILDRFASPDEEYGHNDIRDVNNPKGKRDTHLCDMNNKGECNECINGHAHAQALILPSSINLIVKDGELLKGVWQEIMLVELDHNRKRTVAVHVQGEK